MELSPGEAMARREGDHEIRTHGATLPVPSLLQLRGHPDNIVLPTSCFLHHLLCIFKKSWIAMIWLHRGGKVKDPISGQNILITIHTQVLWEWELFKQSIRGLSSVDVGVSVQPRARRILPCPPGKANQWTGWGGLGGNLLPASFSLLGVSVQERGAAVEKAGTQCLLMVLYSSN